MRLKYAFVTLLLVAGSLIPSSSYAWFIQTPDAVDVAPQQASMLRRGSALALSAISDLYRQLSMAEQEHIPLNREGLLAVSGKFNEAAGLYKNAQGGDLAKIPANFSNLPSGGSILSSDLTGIKPYIPEEFFVAAEKLDNASDFAKILELLSSDMAKKVDSLAGSGFGPQTSSDIQARTLISSLSNEMSAFVRFGSVGAFLLLPSQ
ncbi:hypothetical protein FGG78_21715 [Thioclava sp. BHET1]|nr:hypothetical protein FGG78_21715 [Thioclava sp. BHET1]